MTTQLGFYTIKIVSALDNFSFSLHATALSTNIPSKKKHPAPAAMAEMSETVLLPNLQQYLTDFCKEGQRSDLSILLLVCQVSFLPPLEVEY